MPVIKEYREFFLRNTQVNGGSKPDQETGFPVVYQVTNLLGAVLNVYNRFLKNNYPSETVFQKLYASLTFKLNSEDTATLSDQGLAKQATDAEIIARTSTWSDGMTRFVTPRQLGLDVNESWKNIGGSGNMANGQAIPAYASNCLAPSGSAILPLQIRMKADGKIAIRGWVAFTANPTTPQVLFVLPVGYRIASNMGIVTIQCHSGSGSFPMYVDITPNGNVTLVFNSTFSNSNYLNIPEQELSLT